MLLLYYSAVLYLSFLIDQGEEESFILKSCTRRKTESIEKRFCFDVEAIDRLESLLFDHLLHFFKWKDTETIFLSPTHLLSFYIIYTDKWI